MKTAFKIPIIALGLLLLGSGFFAQPVAAEKKLSLAMSELEGRGLAAGEAQTLSEALANHLAATNAFRIMERGKMDMILKEQGFQQSGACTDQACLVEMGQLLGVEQMLTGGIGKVGSTYSINVRLINVATSEIVHTVSKIYKGEVDGLLTDVLPVMAKELAKSVTGAATMSTPSAGKVESTGKTSGAIIQKSHSSHTLLWVGVGVVVAGGVTAAILLSGKEEVEEPKGSMELSW